MNDKLKSAEANEGSKKPSEKQIENLDDPKSVENQKLEKQFQIDFGSKMKAKKIDAAYKQGAVDYKYEFNCNAGGTLTITKFNESESREKGAQAPAPFKTTVTYCRFYANKVIGLPEIEKVLHKEGSGDKQVGKPADKKDKEHHPHYEVEAGIMIPQIKGGPASHEKDKEFGVQIVGKKILLHTPKAFVAVAVPLQFEWGIKSASERMEVSDSTYRAINLGVGVEAGWIPLKQLVLFGGGGVKGGVEQIQYTNMSQQSGRLVMDTGTKLEFIPSAFVVAGVKTHPTSTGWYLSLSVEPSVTLSSHPHGKAPVFLSTGAEF